MSYSLSPSEFPSLTELNISDDPRKPAPQSSYPASYYNIPEPQHRHYDTNGTPWFIPNWQSTLDPLAAFDAPLISNATASALWNPTLPPYHHKAGAASMEPMFLPRLSLSELEFPPSPSDTCSSSSFYSELSPSPPPLLHVVCDLPVIAPRPLPYHSPTFLQFDLPDINEDLSHPPYTRGGPAKRKRDASEDSGPASKRHAAMAAASVSPYATAQQARAARAARRQLRWC